MIKKQIVQSWIFLAVIIITTGCSLKGFVPAPGRPLRIEGDPICAKISLKQGSHWAQGFRPDASHLDKDTRVALETLWLQDAQGEHASIPAFSRISWQLVMIGAPPELVEEAQKAALDEIHHARLCFALAEGYGGRLFYVNPIPKMEKKGLDFSKNLIETMAMETLFEGCLVEGFFVKLMALAQAQCEEPATLNALKHILQEEESHAAFSWALLEWLLKEHRDQVQPIIHNSFSKIKTYPRPIPFSEKLKPLIEKANPELLIKHGRVPEEEWQQIWDNHCRDIQIQLYELLNSPLA